MKKSISYRHLLVCMLGACVVSLLRGCGFCLFNCENTLHFFISSYEVSREITIQRYDAQQLYQLCMSREGKYVSRYAHNREDAKLFKELARKYNDCHYEETYFKQVGPEPDRKVFFSESIRQITITCDKDIDAAHPAGSSLNDMMLFLSSSPDRFLQYGHMVNPESEAWKKELALMDKRFQSRAKSILDYFDNRTEIIYRKLSEIDFTEYQLVGNTFIVAYFDWEDTQWKTLSDYTLTVTILFEDGVERKASLYIP